MLVNEQNDPTETAKILIRLGFDNFNGYLVDNMLTWHMAGNDSESIDTLNVSKFCDFLDNNDDVIILDVRSDDEIEQDGEISTATHIHITDLPDNYKDLPKNKEIFIFCGSGLRSMLAASFLINKGYKKPKVILGGLLAWKSKKCKIKYIK